ncbi:MAG TPA: 3-phosphoshikimate 1-carboxyvinyltransferase [Candidatus Limnocylindrales bacterium]
MSAELAPNATAGPAAARIVRPATRLRGELHLPGDKSISHRALMLAALAEGQSRISGAGDGADVRSTAGIVARLGVRVVRRRWDARTVDYVVDSPGADGLVEPDGDLDCGNSGTSLRLFAGLVAGLPMTCVLDGDDSLRSRPVARIIDPLRSMGAELHGRRGDTLPPVTVVGHTPLRSVEVATTVPSAQVKSSILLAALRATGRTTIRESVATRDHTERMLRARGVRVDASADAEGATVSLEGGQVVRAIDERIPGDPSAAAFWLVAGAAHPDAELTLRQVGVNPTRRAVIDLLRRMGARIDEQPRGGDTASADDRAGEPTADLTVRSSDLRAIDLGAGDVAAAIDEIPVLCLAAANAHGRTTIRGAAELRHKESDRIAGIATGLTALGVRVAVDGDDLTIEGRSTLLGAAVDSQDDHRLAMTFAVAGLLASGPTTVLRPGSAAVSYPGFFDDLERISA